MAQKRSFMATVISSNGGGDWELPEDGSYLGVLADVIFLGPVATAYGVKDKVQLLWLLDAFDSEGNQFHVCSFYNANLCEKSNLRKDMKVIMGFDVGETYDIDQAIGINKQLVIQQSTSGEKTYANIVAILSAKGKQIGIPEDFERKIDRDGVGSTERPVNAAPGKKAATAKKAAPQKAAAQQTTQQEAPVRQAAQAAKSDKPVPARRPVPPVPPVPPVQEPVEEVYEEAAVEEQVEEPVEEQVEASTAPAPAPVRRVTRPLPAQPATPTRAGTIRRATPAAAKAQSQEITDEDIPF